MSVPPGADRELFCTGERGWGDGKGVRVEKKIFEKKSYAYYYIINVPNYVSFLNVTIFFFLLF